MEKIEQIFWGPDLHLCVQRLLSEATYKKLNPWSRPTEPQKFLERLEKRDKEVEMITDGAGGGGDGRWVC